jgi:hypothetical protein
VREPKVEVVDDGSLEVTVFALHHDYGPDIEAAVRRAVVQGVQQQAAAHDAMLGELLDSSAGIAARRGDSWA